VVTKKEIYVAHDGKEFDTQAKAIEHEESVYTQAERDYRRYLTNTWSGAKLLENHSLEEEGTWKVEGEDPNCDMGGSHHQPHLGYFEGKLDDVVRKAVTLHRFWQWGGGGSISKVEKTLVEKI
jgi:hypothetical protein